MEYHRLIAYYQALFGAENVLVMNYEILLAEPQSFLKRMERFLGVPATNAEVRWENVSPSALTLDSKRRMNRYFVQDATNPTPPFALAGANAFLLRVCQRVDERVPAALRDRRERRWRERAGHEIGARYAESNAATAVLNGLDLRALGYDCG